MTQFIKIDLGNISPTTTTQVDVMTSELSDVEYPEEDVEARAFALRYRPITIPVIEENEETTEDEQPPMRKTLLEAVTANFEECEESPFLSPIVNKRPRWDEAIFFYIASENGFIHLLELNTLINHLQIKKSPDLTKRGDYDPNKKVIKLKNDVFENNDAIEEYFEDRKVLNSEMMEVKMDKTFHLTQDYKEGTKLSIDLSSKLLYKMKFKANFEAITKTNVVSMPNKVLISCSNSYIVRVWTLFGQNLCVLNLEFPLPFKWNLMINRFHQRKLKYIKAMKIKKKIDEKWYKSKKASMPTTPKRNFLKKDPLEISKEIKTFKTLASENMDNS